MLKLTPAERSELRAEAMGSILSSSSAKAD